MTELINEVAFTLGGGFGNMCWGIYRFFLFAAQKRVVCLKSYFISSIAGGIGFY